MKVNILSELNQDDIYNMYIKYANWFELGKAIRKESNDIRLMQNWPNDYELGRAICIFFESKLF